MIGAAVTSDRGGKEGQHGSRPRLSLTYCPWFKEFCAYDGGHVDVRQHGTRTRDERAHRGQCEQRQWLARTRRQEISEKTPQTRRVFGAPAAHAAREAHIFAHTRQVTKLTK